MVLCGRLSCLYCQDALDRRLQGAVQGVAGSFGGLASIVGLTLGGFLYNSIGVASFLISAGVILVVFVMSFRLLKKEDA